jgi:hypothetical protein
MLVWIITLPCYGAIKKRKTHAERTGIANVRKPCICRKNQASVICQSTIEKTALAPDHPEKDQKPSIGSKPHWIQQQKHGVLGHKNSQRGFSKHGGQGCCLLLAMHIQQLGLAGITRERDGEPPNQLFNYGYAILRAIVARSLVSSGCLPAVGIHHRNKYNPFCLADDIMEPYRPIIDKYIIDWIHDQKNGVPQELTREIKSYLLNIPVIDVNIKEARSPLMVGMQRTTASLMDCFEGSLKKSITRKFE